MDKDVSLPRSLCLDSLCAAVPSSPLVSLAACATEGGNAAVLEPGAVGFIEDESEEDN